MVRQRLIASRFATCLAAFVALGLLSKSLAQPAMPEWLKNITVCECKKIAPRICIVDPSCTSCAPVGHACSYVWSFRSADVGGRGAGNPLPIAQARLRYPHRIMETGFSLLEGTGREEPGYGLYSYAIAVNDNNRSAEFLRHLFSAIPPVEDTATQESQTNIFYIPMKNDKLGEFLELLNRDIEKGETLSASSAYYAKNFYDYKMSRALLDHLCDQPAKEIKALCEGDLSRGP